MIDLYKNAVHGAFRHGNVGGCLRRNVSVRLAKALALSDVAELAHGRSRLYFRLGSFHEEHLGVLYFYELFQHFNEPRTRHLCGKPIVPASRPASCSVPPHHSYRCSRSASALQRTSCGHPRTYRDFFDNSLTGAPPPHQAPLYCVAECSLVCLHFPRRHHELARASLRRREARTLAATVGLRSGYLDLILRARTASFTAVQRGYTPIHDRTESPQFARATSINQRCAFPLRRHKTQ